MQPSRPLIYIAALVRTGSTLLSELLTEVPYSYIFHEPHIGKNFFALQKIDADVFKSHGVDLAEFLRWRLTLAFVFRRLRFSGLPQDFMMKEFKCKLLPEISKIVSQVGVKEIRHTGWENYVRHFSNIKVIVTGRDPRDIYLSLLNLWAKGNLNWKKGKFRVDKPFTPVTVAEELNREFDLQRQLMRESDHILLRYEDLCRDAALIDQVKAFAQSPIPETGSIGAFASKHPKKRDETMVHRGEITSLQIFNWKNEKDSKRLDDVHRVSELMAGYRNFWGYD